MSRSRTWKLASAVALTGAGFAAAAAGLFAFALRSGPFMWTPAFGFAEAHDRKAFQLIADSRGPSAEAAAEIQRALQLSPYSNAARLRLVYLQSRNARNLNSETLKLYTQSYDLAPFDYTVAAWRVSFGLEHWSSLTPELRRSVHEEAMAFRNSGSHDVGMRQVLEGVRDPAGRLAASLWLRTRDH